MSILRKKPFDCPLHEVSLKLPSPCQLNVTIVIIVIVTVTVTVMIIIIILTLIIEISAQDKSITTSRVKRMRIMLVEMQLKKLSSYCTLLSPCANQ